MTHNWRSDNQQEFEASVRRRREARMSNIDDLPPDVRALVHEYGWNTVKAFLDVGVKAPRHIRHLVETVLNEFSPTRGASSTQGVSRAAGWKKQEDKQ